MPAVCFRENPGCHMSCSCLLYTSSYIPLPLSFLHMIIVSFPVHHHDAPIRQTTTTPVQDVYKRQRQYGPFGRRHAGRSGCQEIRAGRTAGTDHPHQIQRFGRPKFRCVPDPQQGVSGDGILFRIEIAAHGGQYRNASAAQSFSQIVIRFALLSLKIMCHC